MHVQLVATDAHPTVELTNGEYKHGGDPTAADYADVSLLPQPIAFGDLNGDGLGDAAILLAENYGGSGVFVSVLAVLNSDGQPVQAGAYMVDDRPMITSLRIDKANILLTGDIHGPNDPGCCAALPISEVLGLTKSGLALERFFSAAQDGTPRIIQIQSPASGTQVSPGPLPINVQVALPPGENRLTYRILDQQQKELSSGELVVTTAAQPTAFATQIDLSGVPAGLVARLELADVGSTDGSTLALDFVELMIK